MDGDTQIRLIVASALVVELLPVVLYLGFSRRRRLVWVLGLLVLPIVAGPLLIYLRMTESPHAEIDASTGK
jgi:hypothetical protein